MAAQQNPNKMAALSKEVEDMRCPLQVPVKIETPCQVNNSAKEREGNGPATIPSATSEDFTRAVSRVKQELAEEPPQSWECQWQRVLEVVPAPFITPVWDSLQLPPLTQGGSTEAYLATFERMADASQWPREEWVTHLVPVLSGQAQQAYFSLDAKDKADYGKVKVAILRLDDYLAIEAHRQRFRHFCYQAADGPRMACQQLQELCHCWLRPEGQSKEQILDLLILEQFLVILPQEMQDWIRERGPETCDRAVALAEEYLQEQQETEKWAQQVTVPIEMVIVNSPIVDQAQTEAKYLHKEIKQVDNENSISQEGSFARMGVKDLHQGEMEAEERGWRSPEFGEVLFPKISDLPRRSHVSKCDSERPQKGSLSTRMIKDEVFGGVPTDLEMKRHLCKECGKRFRKKWDLIRHERIHTGEKPYQCPECGNSFNRNTTLTKHLIHSGEKPHQCTYCGRRFTRRSHVVNHQRRHSCQGRS
ncbi:zinc finger and SCAN domain-containing protein 31-like isoform X1 [Pseudonaja textilis]|uniref:Zinc finger and SCAN domain-containing protein 31-like n=1 Tax=Pseudonaja textilis TaxID=8673 RepID=A0A670ZFF0_PSETE|nr:zinc finger and SCAN domain-containing protein 31-like isoform X1 [Pseudonaja textilis]XP_026567555.1 zinc finger and SCAN domain-containing protein 31-like isoform X1 [Pseudonaja textilis]XP_026567556.1 zinc finger and SCAN domain-containing protein 31-like isoform X1 [Pseudonaja textilis]